LVSLVQRFYDPENGSIKLDRKDIKKLNLKCLRSNIGTVSQEPVLFTGTIAENIRFGKQDATMEEIIEAAKLANAHDFIMNLPKGYSSEIGQRGVKLSGGQKQRLCIARVFLKNPPVLILDEATSALDNESESIIKQSLESLAKGRTTIVIAHRLSTIKEADLILVMEQGKVIEKGTHSDLLRENGFYAELYNSQFTESVAG
jgi:ATP-binding cassette subfamily B protein